MPEGAAFSASKSFLVVVSCSFHFSRMRLVTLDCAVKGISSQDTNGKLNSLTSWARWI